MSEMDTEVQRLKDFIHKKPLLEKLFEAEIKKMVKENVRKIGWLIFMIGLIFGMLLSWVLWLLNIYHP